MEIFRRTGYGGLLQIYQAFGIPFETVPSTTLNERLSIQANAVLGVNEMPRVRYMSLGIGGHKGKVGADGISLIDPVQHQATDGGPYKIFPWAVREVTNDFTAVEREKYGMRRVEIIGGVNYYVYYLRRIDVTNLSPKLVTKEIVSNVTTTVDFVPTSQNLSPEQPTIPNGGANVVDGKFLQAIATLEVVFSASEVEEILNASTILYGSEDYALISELGLVSGVDRSVNGNNGLYTEVIAAQTFTHINTLLPMKSQRGGFTTTLDVGATEPMFHLTTP